MDEFHRRLADIVGSDDYIRSFADPSREVLFTDSYSYVIDGETLSANITQTASQVFNTIMDSDSDFVMTGLAGFARPAAATDLLANPAILIQIQDESSGLNFYNRPVLMPFIAGQGGFPFLPPSPRIIRPRSTLSLTAISAQNQAFSGFYFVYHGGRIFYAQ